MNSGKPAAMMKQLAEEAAEAAKNDATKSSSDSDNKSSSNDSSIEEIVEETPIGAEKKKKSTAKTIKKYYMYKGKRYNSWAAFNAAQRARRSRAPKPTPYDPLTPQLSATPPTPQAPPAPQALRPQAIRQPPSNNYLQQQPPFSPRLEIIGALSSLASFISMNRMNYVHEALRSLARITAMVHAVRTGQATGGHGPACVCASCRPGSIWH